MADLLSYEAPAHQASALPIVLPPKLVGRDKSLGQIYTLLKQTKPVLLYGAAGLGKTALAGTLASAYCALPGGVLWLRVHNSPLAELLARIGRAYAVPDLARSENPIGLVGLAMATLTQHKPLVVLDGPLDVNATSEFILRCADSVPVLVVTDSPVDIPGPWTSITLPKLERAASEAAFRQGAPGAATEGLPALLDALDDVPMALAVAAATVKRTGSTPADFAASMVARPGAPAALLAIMAAYNKLSGAQQGLLLLLGAAPRFSATTELLSMMGGAPEAAIESVMTGLVAAHLVERASATSPAVYRLHPLTGMFAVSWLRGKGRFDSLQATVRAAVLRYAEKHSAARGDDALAAEMDNIIGVGAASAAAGRREDAEQLSNALMQAGNFVNARGFVVEFLALRQMGIGPSTVFPATVAPKPFDEPVSPSALDQPSKVELETFDDDGDGEDEPLYNSERIIGDPESFDDEAEAVEAEAPASISATLSMFTEGAFDDDDDDEGESESVADRILSLVDLDDDEAFDDDDGDDDDDEAGDEADGSVAAAQPISAPSLEPIPLIPFEGVTLTDAVPADAIERLRQTLSKARQSGDRRQQVEILASIAQEQLARKQVQEAAASYSEALTVYEALDDKYGQLNTLEQLARLELQIDEAAPAAAHANSGARLARDLNNELVERRMLALLGDAQTQLGEGEEAARAYSDALDLARTAGDNRDEGELLLKLGFARLDSSAVGAAVERFEEALTLFRTQSRRDKEGEALAALGQASADQEHWAEAIKFYTSALHIAREVHQREQELQQLTNLGFAHIQARDLGAAVLRYRQGLHLAFELDNDEEVVAITVELARMLVESPRHIEIAAMLVDAGLNADGSARDLRKLKDRIDDGRLKLDAAVNVIPVTGTVRDYARNAYTLLDQA